jgi:hypothetical protein
LQRTVSLRPASGKQARQRQRNAKRTQPAAWFISRSE